MLELLVKKRNDSSMNVMSALSDNMEEKVSEVSAFSNVGSSSLSAFNPVTSHSNAAKLAFTSGPSGTKLADLVLKVRQNSSIYNPLSPPALKNQRSSEDRNISIEDRIKLLNEQYQAQLEILQTELAILNSQK